MGANHITNGRTGGSDTVTLAEINMPIHSHPLAIYIRTLPEVIPIIVINQEQVSQIMLMTVQLCNFLIIKQHLVQEAIVIVYMGSTGLAGASEPFSILPPYTVLFLYNEIVIKDSMS